MGIKYNGFSGKLLENPNNVKEMVQQSVNT
jgi:hypothetical protein